MSVYLAIRGKIIKEPPMCCAAEAKTAHLEVHRSEQGKGKKLEFANSKTTFDLIYRLWNSVKALCHLDMVVLERSPRAKEFSRKSFI